MLTTAPRAGPAGSLRDLAGLTSWLVARNVGYLVVVWLTVIAVIAAFWWVMASPVGFAIAFVLVSSRQQALLNIEHECIHGTFVRGRRANTIVGAMLCAAPCASPYTMSRLRHLTHHRTLASAADPDRELHAGRSTASRRALRRHFGAGLLGGYALRTIFRRTPVEHGRTAAPRRDLALIVVVHGVLWTALWLAFGWWAYPAFWLAPLVTVTTLGHLVRSLVEHALVPGEEVAHAHRLVTIVSNPFERFLVAPYFMNYHAEHHLHPWVPAPRLPEVRKRLGGSGFLVRSSYLRTLRRLHAALPA